MILQRDTVAQWIVARLALSRTRVFISARNFTLYSSVYTVRMLHAHA